MEQIASQVRIQDSEQVILGNDNVLIGSVHGGIVNVYREQKPALQAKPTPVFILPRRFDGLLDRTVELGRVEISLPANRPIELYGPEGVGKTSLLQYLAHHSMTNHFPDGVIHLRGRNQPLEDILQSIFDIFFTFSAAYKPSQGEIRQALQTKQALILVDDLDLDRSDREALLDSAPACTFMMASAERRLWSDGDALPLRGLPEEDGLQLLSRQLGRPIRDEEEEAARALCRAVEGYPLYLVQAAAMVRDQGYNLAELAHSLGNGAPGPVLAERALENASSEERRAMAAIGTLDGEPLHARHLSSLAQIPDSGTVVRDLLQRGLIQAHSPKYTLSGEVQSALQQRGDLDRWRDRALNYFQYWVDLQDHQSGLLLEEAWGLLRLVEWALNAGQDARALRLARVVEEVLPASLQWGLWQRFLQAALQAARSLGNLPVTAWALHQIGTRALCLGQKETARRYLIRALRLRQSIGDVAGAAVTRHNLNLLLGPPPNSGNNPPKPSGNGGGTGGATMTGLLKVGTLLAIGTIAVIIAAMIIPPAMASPAPAPSPTATLTATLFLAAVETQTPTTAAPTATGTAAAPTDPPATSTATTTATFTATATPTSSPTPQPPTAEPCRVRTDWPVYIVIRGDTLYSIGLRTGASVRELMIANCKTSTLIRVGEALRVPRLPPPPEPTDTDTPPPTPTWTPSPTPTTPQVPADVVAFLDAGQAELTADGSSILPFAVTVSNQGGSPTGVFQLVVLASLSQRQLSASAFDVGSLPAGGQASFRDQFTISPQFQGETVTLVALADYCSPDSGQAPVCRVPETNETNNQAGPLSVALPQQPQPQPPVVDIQTPYDGMVVYFSDQTKRGWVAVLYARGTAKDPEEGDLSGAALEWTDGESGETLGTGTDATLYLYAKTCERATRTIILTATDSQRLSSRASRQVTLAPASVCDPVVDTQTPVVETQPPVVETQTPVIETQTPAIETQPPIGIPSP